MGEAVYNENDPYAADWLEHCIEEGVIAHGKVDRRSIRDVDARDYRGFCQVHLFAGIGIWSAAARLAGWPDDRRAGTVSCPCQPFSAAGKGLGFADPRHLWPDARRVLSECGLDVIFGEQAPTAGHWIDLVASDLEADGYAFGAPVIPAAGFGGAHIRQRFYWVADANNAEWWSDRAPRHERDWPEAGRVEGAGDVGVGRQDGGLGVASGLGRTRSGDQPAHFELVQAGSPELHRLADGAGLGRREERPLVGRLVAGDRTQGRTAGPGSSLSDCDWLPCLDGAWRPVESGTFPLAHEDPGRVGRLRAYGNSLDVETAANFIGAYMDAAPSQRLAA